ncbi:DUF2141 domain-containing protein [Phenylobacterium deserti]|uniref:DUF2141 domain-containing protein n=1 Tax=Phenylobacterium deserti TaxID=1914756 RepID=A0A328ADR8_9CAUL|nr:DUF2141 domain-containing protein [Phenylobacterium deserti]RAK52790.1 DUF2141 domain-containing protein [Phenylobacterium deserti]
MKARTLSPLLVAAAVLAAAAPALAQDDCVGQSGDGAAKLTVETTGMRDAQGEIAVTVYPDDPRRFMARGGKLLRARVRTDLPTTSACFWLPSGVYAVAVYHDRNENRDFDRNRLGRPAEGFGFSNDAPTRFGLPSFDQARFRLPPVGRTLKIKMHYP